ncbi:MAG TPA: peptide chain release factor N(5)-glutamine methyltransferase [Burkholderiaceae bacterium]|nr:peptide chain release factor N(5)-glutamine methyltransferase [Burkholderiaceae bacterium]
MPFSDEFAVADLTVGALLGASTLPTLEARALLAHQLGTSREQLVARPERLVAPEDAQQFVQWAERRRRGEPLAYLLGGKEFYGRMFAVSAAVLIPRPETELLVEAALSLGLRDDAHVLDLGTGSGCIAITLALERPQWQIIATDQSQHAIAVARENGNQWRANNVEFLAGDWFSAVPDQRLDLIVSNPPYVAVGDAHLDALRYEPLPALVAEANGLACLYTIIEGARSHLVPGGCLALEHGHDQATAIKARLVTGGWLQVQTLQDMAGIDRVTLARGAV